MEYIVYKIQNLINHKKYIGSSINVKNRWQQHKNTAYNQQDSKYNYPLYNSIRKYGLQNFDFSIIQICDTVQEMQQLEKTLIIKYNTLNRQFGYNQTLYTECALQDPEIKAKILQQKSQKCALVNEQEEILQIYPSYQEAARQNHIKNMANHIRLVCKGQQHSINNILLFRDLDENGNVIHINNISKNYRNREKIVAIPINNPNKLKYYDSISSAAIELETDRASIHSCLRGDTKHSLVKGYIIRRVDENNNIIENNIKISDKLKEYDEKFPLINNERHTKVEWCKIYNVKWPTIRNRLKKYNITFQQALTATKTDLSSFKRRE